MLDWSQRARLRGVGKPYADKGEKKARVAGFVSM
jgi:hypothetical protein